MALQVWLPLNGNLRNQGVSDFDTSLSCDTVTYVAGKTGANATFSNAMTNQTYCAGLDGVKEFTIALWAKLTPESTFGQYRDVMCVGYNSETNHLLRLEVTNTTGSALRWFGFGMDSSGSANMNNTLGVWNHFVVSVKGDKLYTYHNGKQLGTTTIATPGNILNGNIRLGDNNMYCSIADLRIYDSCLSVKQIKEISKGLVAHYKLAPPGAANLERNTNCGISNWEFNVGAYYTGKAEEITWRGVRACKFSITTGDTQSSSKWRVIQHRVDSFSQTVLKPSTNYVISFDSSSPYASECRISSGSGQNNLCASSTLTYTVNNDGSYHYVCVITTHEESNTSWSTDDQYIYIQYPVPSDGFGIVANLKLEEGTVDTPWCPNKQDIIYTQFNYDTLINEDSGGYLYDTVTKGTLTWAGATNRYHGSVLFNGINTNYIYRNKFDWLKPPFTFNCWCNQISRTSQKGSSGTTTLQFVESQGRDCGLAGFSLVLSNGVPKLFLGTETDGTYHQINSDTALTLNTWHMLTGTYDGTTVKLYVDGVLKASKAVATAISWAQSDGFVIGKMAYKHTNDTYYFPFNGYINDVRVYSTSLDANDVLALYNNSAYIDNYGNIGAYEFIEED